jgi:hypothetical protein
MPRQFSAILEQRPAGRARAEKPLLDVGSVLIGLSLLTAVPVLPAQDAKSSRRSTPVFVEVAAAAGLDFRHYNGMTGQFYLPEIMGPGAALFDYDNDGDLDVYLVQGQTLQHPDKPAAPLIPWRGKDAPRGRLYRNDLHRDVTDGRQLKFTDVTESSRISSTGYGMGAATGDFDNDGWLDLYITNVGSNQMLRNNGNGTFSDVTAKAGTGDPRWSTSAAFVDFDRDGWLDLFVTNYVAFSAATSPTCFSTTTARDYCSPRAFRPVPSSLFRNRGDGTFENLSGVSGITREFGAGLGVVTADFNRDGEIDIYVANDGDPNQLWINRTKGRFANEALMAGAAVNRNGQPEAGMGVDAGDFDGDGDDDIFLTHLMEETNTLYRNLGDLLFEDYTVQSGLGIQTARYTGFGTLWFDIDGDGWLDLLSANGAVRTMQGLPREGDPYRLGQPNQIFRNKGDGTFIEISQQGGEIFSQPEISRGAAFGDIDNDGDTDVLICNNNGPVRLFINQSDGRQQWIGLRLVGKDRRDMLGSRVEIRIGNRTLTRRVHTDGGYLSAQDPRVLAGVGGSRRVDRVRVYWPSGRTEEWTDLPVGRYNLLVEGSAARK